SASMSCLHDALPIYDDAQEHAVDLVEVVHERARRGHGAVPEDRRCDLVEVVDGDARGAAVPGGEPGEPFTDGVRDGDVGLEVVRSEEHTSELQSRFE